MHAEPSQALCTDGFSLPPMLGDMPEPAVAPITVMMAFDCRSQHAAWLGWMAWEAGIEVAGGPVTDAGGLPGAVESQHPDVLLLESTILAGLDAPALARLRRCRQVRVLLVAEENPRAAADVLRHRFSGLLPAPSPAYLCLKAIRAVHAGEFWLSRRLMAEALSDAGWPLAAALTALPAEAERTSDSQTLTPRERQVVAALNQGCSNKEIARELGIVEDTVKKHLKSVYSKLGVRRRAMVMLQTAAGM